MNVMSKKNLIVWINDDRTTSNFYWVFLNFQTVTKKKWFLTFNSPNSFLKLSYFIFQIFWTAFIEVSFIFFFSSWSWRYRLFIIFRSRLSCWPSIFLLHLWYQQQNYHFQRSNFSKYKNKKCEEKRISKLEWGKKIKSIEWTLKIHAKPV